MKKGELAIVLLSCFQIKNTERGSMKKPSKQHKSQKPIQHFLLRGIEPLTDNQRKTFQAYHLGKHLMLHGVAGTGKTFISLYLALEEILKKNSDYDGIVIVRSVVPSRDMGFLPGSASEKAKVYEEPYREICDDVFGRGDGYDILRNKKLVSFVTTSHLRGMTFHNRILIVDETQNMSGGELDTVITRVGQNCKIIFCGDFKQTDLNNRERGGFFNFMEIIKRMNNFEFIEFGIDDIVRSDMVKEYITIKDRMGFDFL